MNRVVSALGLAAVAALLLVIAGCHSSSSTAEQAVASTPAAVATARVTAAPPVKKTLRRESIQPGQIEAFEMTPLFTVARTDTVRIFVAVPEMDSPFVQAGGTGYVSVQAIPDRLFEGKVTRTSWV